MIKRITTLIGVTCALGLLGHQLLENTIEDEREQDFVQMLVEAKKIHRDVLKKNVEIHPDGLHFIPAMASHAELNVVNPMIRFYDSLFFREYRGFEEKAKTSGRNMLYIPGYRKNTYQAFYLSTGTSNAKGHNFPGTFFPNYQNKLKFHGGHISKCNQKPYCGINSLWYEKLPQVTKGTLPAFLAKFGNWQDLQASLCLGGFWDDPDTSVFDETEIHRDEFMEAREFIVHHDFICQECKAYCNLRENSHHVSKFEFVKRVHPLRDVSDEIKQALRRTEWEADVESLKAEKEREREALEYEQKRKENMRRSELLRKQRILEHRDATRKRDAEARDNKLIRDELLRIKARDAEARDKKLISDELLRIKERDAEARAKPRSRLATNAGEAIPKQDEQSHPKLMTMSSELGIVEQWSMQRGRSG